MINASRLSRCVKGALRNMPNVVDNYFETCTDGFYGDSLSPTWKRGFTLKCFVAIINGGESSSKILILLIGIYLIRNSDRTDHVTTPT